MRERINEHDRDIRFARTQTSAGKKRGTKLSVSPRSSSDIKKRMNSRLETLGVSQ